MVITVKDIINAINKEFDKREYCWLSKVNDIQSIDDKNFEINLRSCEKGKSTISFLSEVLNTGQYDVAYYQSPLVMYDVEKLYDFIKNIPGVYNTFQLRGIVSILISLDVLREKVKYERK